MSDSGCGHFLAHSPFLICMFQKTPADTQVLHRMQWSVKDAAANSADSRADSQAPLSKTVKMMNRMIVMTMIINTNGARSGSRSIA